MKRTHLKLLIHALGLSVLALVSSQASAQAPSLGTAASFSVLGGSTVTNTGPTQVVGNLGVSPGSAVTGFPPGIVTSGTTHAADSVAAQAQADNTTAYNGLAALPCGTDLTGQDLGGKTLVAGVYCFSSSAQLTGTLLLDAQGNANAQFIFQIGSTLTTASGSVVQVINGGSPCNVYWQVGSSATLGTTTSFEGNILALTSITLTTGANVTGRLLAQTGAVTLDSNGISGCAAGAACPPLTIAPATIPNPTAGSVYNQVLTASGGTAPYTFSIIAGALPLGLTLSPSGVISGTTFSSGSFTFTVRAADALGCFGSRSYTITLGANLSGTTGGPTLDSIGLSILILFLTIAGVVLVNRFGS